MGLLLLFFILLLRSWPFSPRYLGQKVFSLHEWPDVPFDESETEEMELEGDDAPEIDEDGGMERRNQRHECYFCDTFHN